MHGGDRIDPLDLMQIASIVFIDKLDTWDPTKNSKMITYYYRDARTKMQRFIMNHAYSVRQGSVFLQHLAFTISKFVSKHLNEHQIEPTEIEIAKKLGVSVSTIKLCARSTNIHIKSSDETQDLYLEEAYPAGYFPVTDLIERTLIKAGLNEQERNIVVFAIESSSKHIPEEILNILIK
ncbi:hypothetical protein CL621_01035 [archaeon]|nr:hypothetical protein [archaeon]